MFGLGLRLLDIDSHHPRAGSRPAVAKLIENANRVGTQRHEAIVCLALTIAESHILWACCIQEEIFGRKVCLPHSLVVDLTKAEGLPLAAVLRCPQRGVGHPVGIDPYKNSTLAVAPLG